MIDPRPALTGRTTVFSSVEVLDHERGEWVTFLPVDSRPAASGDDLVQEAIDAGWDDVRFVVHASGNPPRE